MDEKGPAVHSKSAIPRRLLGHNMSLGQVATTSSSSTNKPSKAAGETPKSRIPVPTATRHNPNTNKRDDQFRLMDKLDSPRIATSSSLHKTEPTLQPSTSLIQTATVSHTLRTTTSGVGRPNSGGKKERVVEKTPRDDSKRESNIPLPSSVKGKTLPSRLPVESSRDKNMRESLMSMLTTTKPTGRRDRRQMPSVPLERQTNNSVLQRASGSPTLITGAQTSLLTQSHNFRTRLDKKVIEGDNSLPEKSEKAAATATAKIYQSDGTESVPNKKETAYESSISRNLSSRQAQNASHQLLTKIAAAATDHADSPISITSPTTTMVSSKAGEVESLAQNRHAATTVEQHSPHSTPSTYLTHKHTHVPFVQSAKAPTLTTSVTSTFVSSSTITPVMSSKISNHVHIEQEGSGQSSDSLQSRGSERNMVPLSEEFERKKDSSRENTSSQVQQTIHLKVPTHIRDKLMETSSLPDLQHDSQEQAARRPISPTKQLPPWYSNMKAEIQQLTDQLKVSQSEQQAKENELRQSQREVSDLRRKFENVHKELERDKGTVSSLKRRLEEQSLEIIQLKRDHSNDVTRIRKEMGEKQEAERARLLNQIRELTKMKEQKNAEVSELKGSLSEAKQKANVRSTTLQITESKYEAAIQQLKIELQAQTDLQKMSEKMYSKLSATSSQLEKKITELTNENNALKESLKDTSETNRNLQRQLKESDDYVAKHQKEKAETRAGIEKKHVDKLVKQEVEYQEKMQNLKQKLEDVRASNAWLLEQLQEHTTVYKTDRPAFTQHTVFQPKYHSRRIVPNVSARYLEDTVASTNKKNTRVRYPSLERFSSPKHHNHQRSLTMPRSRTPPPSARQWEKTFPQNETSSHRFTINKHGDILEVLSGLKKEGFDITSRTSDQIISYLWTKKKALCRDLEDANRALREKRGDNQFGLLQKWKMEAETKADKLRMAEQQLEVSARTAKTTQDLLKKKLEDLLLQSGEKEESAYVEQKKSLTNSLMSENRSLKTKVVELRGEIMTKSASISQSEGDLAELKRKNESMERELNFEMRQKALLEAKVDSLQKQLKQQLLKFNSLQEDSMNVSKDGSQQRAEIGKLKATIGKLEGEVSILQQELVHEKEEKQSIQAQLETYSSKMLMLQSQSLEGNATIVDLKSKVQSLSDECRYQKDELGKETHRCSALDSEVEALRKSLHEAQRKNASLEAEFLRLRAEHKSAHQELSDSTKNIVEIEKKMKLSEEDLQINKELSKQLQEVVAITQQELNGIRRKLDQERQTNSGLNDTVQTLTKKLDSRDSALATIKKELSQKKFELQKLEQDRSTFSLDADQLHTTMESMKRQIHQHEKELKSAELSLDKKTSALAEAQQRAELAIHQAENSRAELEELRTQLTSTEGEMERLNTSKSILTSENLEFRTKFTEMKVTLAERKTLLQKKEDELASIKKEKSGIQTELAEIKREASSQKCILTELEKEVELKAHELEIERRNVLEVMEEFKKKTNEIKYLKHIIEEKESTTASLQEEKNTLEIELADIQGECMAMKSLKKSLEQRLEACTKKSDAEETYYHQNIEELKNSLDHTQNELMALTKRHAALEREYHQIQSQRESCENEMAVLKEEHHLVKGNLTTAIKVKKALEDRSESLQKQLDETMEVLVHKTSELKHVQNNLSLTQAQLEEMERELTLHRKDLSVTTENYDRVKIEGEHKEDKLRILTHEIQKLREELQREKQRADTNSDEAIGLHTKCQELSEKLRQSEQELCEVQIVRKDSHANYINTINALKNKHEEQIEELRTENSSLNSEITQINDQLFAKEREVSSLKEDLDVAANRLSNAESKCITQRAELSAKEDSHELLKSDHLHLESKNVEARAEITDLKGKLSSQITSNELLKSEISEVKRESLTLREKLKIQRENAASSLNKTQQEYHEKSAQLRAKIQEMTDKLNEANSSMLEAEQEISKIQVENERLLSSLSDENEKNIKARYEIQEQVASIKVLEQRIEQYQSSTDIERNAKLELKQNLSDERMKRQNLELLAAEQEEKYNMVTRELCQVQKSLKKEEARNERLKIEMDKMKQEILEARHHHDVLREQQKISKQHMEFEISSIRQRHHSDKKSLKEKIKVLQDNLQSTMDQLDGKINHIKSLESNARSLSEHIDDLNRKLASSEEKLQNKRDECKKLRSKQHTNEIQIAQLQADVRGLESTQLQLEECRKSAEAKSKTEIKRVLSEVTEQMEQQNTAQKYLEKLRSENELIAIREKERVISELRNELKLSSQESKKDRSELEHLKMESLHLKNQQLEQDKSRRRLEARLEQVNDTLSKTLPTRQLRTLMSQEGPLYSSTPSPSRSFSGYRS